MEVFKTIDPMQKGVCQITYDYMYAYFEFFRNENCNDEEAFKKLGEMVEKYKDCHIVHFRSLFKKLAEQLNEIEEVRLVKADREAAEANDEQAEAIDVDGKEEITEEQRRQAELATKQSLPVIHEARLDENTGELSIESDNIDKLTIKYYLIDAEILFSRSPFIKDQAEQCSYVTPYKQLDQATQAGATTRIPLPEDL